MTNDLLEGDLMRVYEEPFSSLGFQFASARFESSTQRMHVELKNGLKISFPKNASLALKSAADPDLDEIVVHDWAVEFPRIHDGFSLEPLAFGDFGNEPWDSNFLEEWQKKFNGALNAA